MPQILSSAGLRQHPALPILSRLLAATLGAYAAAWATLHALSVAPPLLLPHTTIPRASLWFLAYQLAPIPLLLCLLWAFAARRLWQAWALPLGIVLLSLAISGGARLMQ